MVLNICVKFHEYILNDFEVTERTRVCGKNCHFSMFKLQYLRKDAIQSYDSCALYVVSSSLTFVLTFMKISQTVFELRNRQGLGFVTDRQTADANGKNNVSLTPRGRGGRHNYRKRQTSLKAKNLNHDFFG